MNVKAYFERIGLEMPETIVPDSELLRKLQVLQVLQELRVLLQAWSRRKHREKVPGKVRVTELILFSFSVPLSFLFGKSLVAGLSRSFPSSEAVKPKETERFTSSHNRLIFSCIINSAHTIPMDIVIVVSSTSIS